MNWRYSEILQNSVSCAFWVPSYLNCINVADEFWTLNDLAWFPIPCFPSSKFYLKKVLVSKFAFRWRILINLRRE